jgi:excisionase family DNA binding protein
VPLYSSYDALATTDAVKYSFGPASIERGIHMETDALLSVEEAARRLGGISKWTVHQWLSQGKLRRTKVGRRTMIRESELARVIREEENPRPFGTPKV